MDYKKEDFKPCVFTYDEESKKYQLKFNEFRLAKDFFVARGWSADRLPVGDEVRRIIDGLIRVKTPEILDSIKCNYVTPYDVSFSSKNPTALHKVAGLIREAFADHKLLDLGFANGTPLISFYQNEDDENMYTVIFGDFGFAEEFFVKKGIDGGGYTWWMVVESLIRLKAPEFEEEIEYDPEASMFCAYGSNHDALHKVTELIREALADEQLLEAAIENADPELLEESKSDFSTSFYGV